MTPQHYQRYLQMLDSQPGEGEGVVGMHQHQHQQQEGVVDAYAYEEGEGAYEHEGATAESSVAGAGRQGSVLEVNRLGKQRKLMADRFQCIVNRINRLKAADEKANRKANENTKRVGSFTETASVRDTKIQEHQMRLDEKAENEARRRQKALMDRQQLHARIYEKRHAAMMDRIEHGTRLREETKRLASQMDEVKKYQQMLNANRIYTIKCQHEAKRLENSQKREVRDTEKRLENTTKCHQLHDEMIGLSQVIRNAEAEELLWIERLQNSQAHQRETEQELQSVQSARSLTRMSTTSSRCGEGGSIASSSRGPPPKRPEGLPTGRARNRSLKAAPAPARKDDGVVGVGRVRSMSGLGRQTPTGEKVPIEELENLTLEELDDLTRQEAAYFQRLESIRIRKASQEGGTVVSPVTSLAQSPIDTLPVPLGHGGDGSGAENQYQYQQQQQQPHQQPHQQQQQQHKSCYPPPLPRGPTPSASTGLLQPSHTYNTAAVARNSPLLMRGVLSRGLLSQYVGHPPIHRIGAEQPTHAHASPPAAGEADGIRTHTTDAEGAEAEEGHGADGQNGM
ncbi:unnamed protein product [Vitrella brassicaformis CCMP3155]|uniref:Uncharacterized protein n=2 Tax=Vitrella brassicaformis TaxID=1169539 RepID=A0A0G4GA30_VITBC|nr:unnamed protein product [Vitrella brassicaformis CCMP3155]|eukprot:CEM25805.1 unnamed protein product [Vitrella brassicaformis CCMP3155]